MVYLYNAYCYLALRKSVNTTTSQILCVKEARHKSKYCVTPFLWNSRTGKSSEWY